jgi:hypothetical protein
MKACMKDPKTKKLTETEDFEHALPLLNRLEERYLSDAERQKGVAWSKFFHFTAHASESGMDLVTCFDGIVHQLPNLGEPVTPAQLFHRFLEASLQSNGTHHQLLATAIYTNLHKRAHLGPRSMPLFSVTNGTSSDLAASVPAILRKTKHGMV